MYRLGYTEDKVDIKSPYGDNVATCPLINEDRRSTSWPILLKHHNHLLKLPETIKKEIPSWSDVFSERFECDKTINYMVKTMDNSSGDSNHLS
jgi:hypothetical protein